jgi:cytoskeletal protein RodZ
MLLRHFTVTYDPRIRGSLNPVVREFWDVKVGSMKKFLGSVLMIAAGVGGFLWWKRKQVIVANEVAADPWPAAVASPDVEQTQAPTGTGTPEVAPAAKKAAAKKAPVKKSAAKKPTPKPPRPSEPKPQ